MPTLTLYVVPEEEGSVHYVFRPALPDFVANGNFKLHGTVNITDGSFAVPTASSLMNGIAVLNSLPDRMYAIVQVELSADLIAALTGG